MKKYHSIAFDLDDTLLDTSGLLVPAAAKTACEAMIAAGLQCDLQTCLSEREVLAAQLSHTDIFHQIATKHGCTQPGKAVHDALEAFYNPVVPPTLPLLPEALNNLESLKENYSLYLVTMGSYKTQAQKVRSLGIEKYFEKVFILNGFIGERKQTAFQKILTSKNIKPTELLSVGNRLSSEIRDAKILGSETCYFAYGEHVGEKPQVAEDHPDYTIYHHEELIRVCGL